MIVVLLMILSVDCLLLFASGQFLGTRGKPLRIILGALLDVIFTAVSLLSGFSFLKSIGWRITALLLTGLMAFGLSKSAIPRLLLFVLLNISLGGITGSETEIASILLGAAGIGLACAAMGKQQSRIPVELTYGAQTVQITALRDTGNTLRDPITGKSVLIVSADIAKQLTGISRETLEDPVKAVGTIPGLRLIPYHTVGGNGFLPVLMIHKAKIGDTQGSTLVAFSAQTFESSYQALTGGTV